ncbi:hypothetical protein VUR80DRAFT_1258 [Thermomyces stellatus]
MLGDCTFQDLRQASPLSGERKIKTHKPSTIPIPPPIEKLCADQPARDSSKYRVSVVP